MCLIQSLGFMQYCLLRTIRTNFQYSSKIVAQTILGEMLVEHKISNKWGKERM